jgi:Leucine-rich repeat (LRR) protein
LTHIREFIFKDYRILETLVLSDNEIDVVDSRAFSGIGMLINIDLSNNNLPFIPFSIFSDNPVLESVSFRGNPLVYVPDSSPIFSSPSVISLDLSFCSLTSINSKTFSQLPGLQVLDLYSNNLREIRKDMFKPLTELVVIDLGNNFWKCDCDIVKVLSYLSERRQSRLLDGEHKPVKCFDAGVYKTIWTAANKNKVCAEQSPVISSTTIPTESSNILEPKENKEETATAGSWWGELLSWNTNTFLVFIILPVMLGIATLVSLITVNCVFNFMSSRRQSQCPLFLRTEPKIQKGIYFQEYLPLHLPYLLTLSTKNRKLPQAQVLRTDPTHMIHIIYMRELNEVCLIKFPNLTHVCDTLKLTNTIPRWIISRLTQSITYGKTL